jgi:hypothetical protein
MVAVQHKRKHLVITQPVLVGLVLGGDFNSRGMETCKGSIPPLRHSTGQAGSAKKG